MYICSCTNRAALVINLQYICAWFQRKWQQASTQRQRIDIKDIGYLRSRSPLNNNNDKNKNKVKSIERNKLSLTSFKSNEIWNADESDT